MSTATITPIEALLGCIAALKLIDFADCKDELVWKDIVAAQGTAEGVLRDYVEPEPVAWVSLADNGNIRMWSKEPLVTFGFKTQPLYAAPVATKPAVVAARQPEPEMREFLRDALASGLSSVYYCNRVWSAWGVGTMTQDDFTEASEIDDIVGNLCDIAIATLGPFSAAPAIAAQEELRQALIDLASAQRELVGANSELAALRLTAIAAPAEVEQFDPVEGDLLPAVGEKVLIHLARQDDWIEHTVTGYYVWPAHPHQVKPGQKDAHRVFVRVKDEQGYDNARLLSEVRRAAIATGEKNV